MLLQIVPCPDDTHEAEWVAARVRLLLNRGDISNGDVAVLYRNHRLSRRVQQQLVSCAAGLSLHRSSDSCLQCL